MTKSEKYLLALESSTARGGVALLRNKKIITEIFLEEGLRHGRELLPAVAEVLKEAGVDKNQLGGVAVSSGPGSYTGVRVGVMAAKALAYGLDCELVAVSSLAALAFTALLADQDASDFLLMPVQDARRDEVYAAFYALKSGQLIPVSQDIAVTPEEAVNMVEDMLVFGKDPLLLGSGVENYRELYKSFSVREKNILSPSPGAVGLLAWEKWENHELADVFALQPLYLRRAGDPGWKKDELIKNS